MLQDLFGSSIYPIGQPEKERKMYVVLDKQSNRSLAQTEFFLNMDGQLEPHILKTCSGVMEVTGRHANNFVIESMDGTTGLPLLPPSHLNAVMSKIPEIDPNAAIFLLLGRDILSIHKVREQYNVQQKEP